MERNYIELKRPERKYIPLQRTDNNFTAIRCADDFYEINESIPCGELMLEIRFFANKSGKILTPIVNNYFDYLDQISSMCEYGDYKKDLLFRIRLDMEKKKIKNSEILETFKR